MRKCLSIPAIPVFARWIIGAIFVYAGWEKIQDPQAFADSIASFQIIPLAGINPLALGLPFFELLLGLCLITGWKKDATLFSACVLSTLFVLILVQALIRGLQVNCGCFGNGNTAPAIWLSLGGDLLLGAVCWNLYMKSLKELNSSPGFKK